MSSNRMKKIFNPHQSDFFNNSFELTESHLFIKSSSGRSKEKNNNDNKKNSSKKNIKNININDINSNNISCFDSKKKSI